VSSMCTSRLVSQSAREWNINRKQTQLLILFSAPLFTGIGPMAPATPGRLQYYKVDHEPFLPDDVKWAIRMCNKVVVREFALNYEEDVQR
jgi:hypothetical protein